MISGQFRCFLPDPPPQCQSESVRPSHQFKNGGHVQLLLHDCGDVGNEAVVHCAQLARSFRRARGAPARRRAEQDVAPEALRVTHDIPQIHVAEQIEQLRERNGNQICFESCMRNSTFDTQTQHRSAARSSHTRARTHTHAHPHRDAHLDCIRDSATSGLSIPSPEPIHTRTHLHTHTRTHLHTHTHAHTGVHTRTHTHTHAHTRTWMMLSLNCTRNSATSGLNRPSSEPIYTHA